MDWRLPTDIVDVCAAHHDATAADAPHVRLVMAADAVVSILEKEKAEGEPPSLEPLEAFGLSATQAERVVTRTRELAL
jgi:hypothetical protein